MPRGERRSRRDEREREDEELEGDALVLNEDEEDRWWQALIALASGAASGSGEAIDVQEVAHDADEMIRELRLRRR